MKVGVSGGVALPGFGEGDGDEDDGGVGAGGARLTRRGRSGGRARASVRKEVDDGDVREAVGGGAEGGLCPTSRRYWARLAATVQPITEAQAYRGRG